MGIYQYPQWENVSLYRYLLSTSMCRLCSREYGHVCDSHGLVFSWARQTANRCRVPLMAKTETQRWHIKGSNMTDSTWKCDPQSPHRTVQSRWAHPWEVRIPAGTKWPPLPFTCHPDGSMGSQPGSLTGASGTNYLCELWDKRNQNSIFQAWRSLPEPNLKPAPKITEFLNILFSITFRRHAGTENQEPPRVKAFSTEYCYDYFTLEIISFSLQLDTEFLIWFKT